MVVFLLKLTLCWGFFALFYHVLLRGETFFSANRAYLLGTLVLGVALSLGTDWLALPRDEAGVPIVSLPVVSVGLQQVDVATKPITDHYMIWIIYGAGAVVATLRLLWGGFQLARIIRGAEPVPLPQGIMVYRSAVISKPFSFWQWIVVPKHFSPNVHDPETALLLAHEQAHLRGRHSLDVLLISLFCIIFWFHPLMHWYRMTMRTLHEYLADAEATHYNDRKQYGLLLIRQSQSGLPIALAHHFYQSPLKQRIMMLMKCHSTPSKALRYALLLPLTALFVVLFQKVPAFANAIENQGFSPKTHFEQTLSLPDSLPDPAKEKAGKSALTKSDECDVPPAFPGGMEALTKYMQESVLYPEDALKEQVAGKVMVEFVVEKDGSLTQIKGKLADPAQGDQRLIMEALRVVRSMPKWQAGQKTGKSVRCTMVLPVVFTAPAASKVKELFDVDKLPVFPGGEKAMLAFLAEHIKYPESEKKTVQNTVAVVSFVVGRDGSIQDIEPLKGSAVMTDEVIRVVRLMPKWEPAMSDGIPVKVRYSLPVRFRTE